MNKVGFCYDERMLLHYDEGELERPERIKVIYNELIKREYIDKMTQIESIEITKEELLLVHDKKYIDTIHKIFTMHENAIKVALSHMNSMFGNKNSLITASVAAGSTLNMMKEIIDKTIYHGIAIVRSPGHHAHRGYASGFCFFNNIAIAAKYGMNCGKRIAIVDFDIHENDGVVDIFKNDNDVLAISIHRYDYGKYYPGTGKARDTYNLLSIPLNIIAYDKTYYDIFDSQVIPKLKEFNPDIILVSAGFDAGEGDPLGGFHVTPLGYYNLVKKLLDLGKPTLLVLEGGYDLNTIATSMAECTRALLENVQLL